MQKLSPSGRVDCRDSTILATAFDTLVAVLVQGGKVLPQFPVLRVHRAVVAELGEANR